METELENKKLELSQKVEELTGSQQICEQLQAELEKVRFIYRR